MIANPKLPHTRRSPYKARTSRRHRDYHLDIDSPTYGATRETPGKPVGDMYAAIWCAVGIVVLIVIAKGCVG